MELQFRYNVSRPYPIRFFTPFVIVIFLVATALLTLFNTIIDGYDLRISYSTKPNVTLATKMWYDRPGFGGIKKLSSTCEAKDISVQQKFYTNKTGLVYEIGAFRKIGEGSSVPSASMLYLNNPLEACSVNNIKMEMSRYAGRTAEEVTVRAWSTQLFADISCSITNVQGGLRFNASTSYDLFPSSTVRQNIYTNNDWAHGTLANAFQFVVTNNTLDSALWWSESLMSWWWQETNVKLQTWLQTLTMQQMQSITLRFWPHETEDISSNRFFRMYVWVLYQRQNGSMEVNSTPGGIPYEWLIDDGGMSNTSAGNSTGPSVRAFYISATALAKSFYSTIGADLGIAAGANILLDENVLQNFTSKFSEARAFDNYPGYGLVGPATDSYNALKEKTGAPSITPSTMSTTYLCQTPVRKLPATLIVAVLLADLVLLRALWTIVTWAAMSITAYRDATAYRCEGCIEYSPIAPSDRDGLCPDIEGKMGISEDTQPLAVNSAHDLEARYSHEHKEGRVGV